MIKQTIDLAKVPKRYRNLDKFIDDLKEYTMIERFKEGLNNYTDLVDDPIHLNEFSYYFYYMDENIKQEEKDFISGLKESKDKANIVIAEQILRNYYNDRYGKTAEELIKYDR